MQEILDRLQDWATAGVPVSPGMWIDEAFKLLAHIGKASDMLIEIDHQIAKEKWNYKGSKPKVTNVDAVDYIESLDVYLEREKLKKDIDLAHEYVLMAKKRATLASDEIKY